MVVQKKLQKYVMNKMMARDETWRLRGDSYIARRLRLTGLAFQNYQSQYNFQKYLRTDFETPFKQPK